MARRFPTSSAFSLHVPAEVERAVIEQHPDPAVHTCSLHMHYVAQMENAYWGQHFYEQSYYVPGRSYDQYQPAFKLGWDTALKTPDVSFSDFEGQLEQAWLHQKTSSLLTWREVRGAVQDAWAHALGQMAHLQTGRKRHATMGSCTDLLQPLYRKSLQLVAQLQQLQQLQGGGFVGEVIERHQNLLHEHAKQLAQFNEQKVDGAAKSGLRISDKWSSHWRNFKMALELPEEGALFAACERSEWQLVRSYEKVLKETLPDGLRHLLQEQLKQLKINADKLAWVRKNWTH